VSHHFRVSSLVRPRLDELGVPIEAVLREAGLPTTFFEQARIYVETSRFFALWRAIAQVSGDPAIGLKLGNEQRLERYDPIAIASLYARSFRNAVERAGRYKQLMCPEKILIRTTGDEAAVVFKWTMADETEPTMLTDMCFAWVQAIGHRGTGGRLYPLRVEFTRPSGDRDLYEHHFACPVRFRSKRNALVFSKAKIDLPFLTYNPDLIAALAPQLEEELRFQQTQESLVGQTKTTIKRLLAGQRPDLEQVARELGQSPRTLQRKLAELGFTFQEVLAEARHELARHYLLHSGRELNETAYLLGFSDANSFYRAFVQWEGIPPGRWREAHGVSPRR
jgi:AraC-like DNA-binding protein